MKIWTSSLRVYWGKLPFLTLQRVKGDERKKKNKTSSSHTNSVSGSKGEGKDGRWDGSIEEVEKSSSSWSFLAFTGRKKLFPPRIGGRFLGREEDYLRRFFRSLIMLHYEIFISFCWWCFALFSLLMLQPWGGEQEPGTMSRKSFLHRRSLLFLRRCLRLNEQRKMRDKQDKAISLTTILCFAWPIPSPPYPTLFFTCTLVNSA